MHAHKRSLNVLYELKCWTYSQERLLNINSWAFKNTRRACIAKTKNAPDCVDSNVANGGAKTERNQAIPRLIPNNTRHDSNSTKWLKYRRISSTIDQGQLPLAIGWNEIFTVKTPPEGNWATTPIVNRQFINATIFVWLIYRDNLLLTRSGIPYESEETERYIGGWGREGTGKQLRGRQAFSLALPPFP